MLKVGIIGAGGFTGQELLQLLAKHEQTDVIYATSNEYKEQKVSETFRSLAHPSLNALTFSAHPKTQAEVEKLPPLDLLFTATPDDVSLQLIPWFRKKNIRVIDIAGIFRLKDKEQIQKFYNIDHDQPQLLQQAVYGLPEVYREEIKKAELVANPGCYPTSVLLPFFAIKEFLSKTETTIIVDAKSGTSGAGGRKEKDSLSYSGVNENFRAYKIAAHQHQPEIQLYANLFANSANPLRVRFTPHLLPLSRGIFSTAYISVKETIDFSQWVKAARDFAQQETFVRFYENANDVEIKKVARTNFLDFSLTYDDENRLVVMTSAIDNLLKGAAGQAVQNMNLMYGLPEHTALF